MLILKEVGIFGDTPDDILAQAAELLEEVVLPPAHDLFKKGDSGSCMYAVVDGRIRIHADGHTLGELGAGQVFGEMALLDSAPRVASATAMEETLLLKLDQEPFFELVADRIEVARGIMAVLSARLRERVREVGELHARLAALNADDDRYTLAGAQTDPSSGDSSAARRSHSAW